MPEIIHEIAQLELPQDLVKQVDLPSLINKFNTNFRKLGALKTVRDKHESRSVWKKGLDFLSLDNTLDVAQLDALEVQAEFSKSIGQLMVLSILQSQYLERQQIQLSEQQQKIKQQTTSIESHNGRLEEQHEDLANCNKKLEQQVNNFVELKGFTHGEVKRLLDIAHKVEGTEAELHRYVEKSLGQIKEQISYQVNTALESVNTSMSNLAFETDKNINKLRDDAIEQLEIAKKLIFTIQGDFNRAETEAKSQREAIESVEVAQGTFGNQLSELSGATSQLKNMLGDSRAVLQDVRTEMELEKAVSIGLNQKLETISKQFELYQSNVNLKFGRLHIMLGGSLALTIGLVGFILFRMQLLFAS